MYGNLSTPLLQVPAHGSASYAIMHYKDTPYDDYEIVATPLELKISRRRENGGILLQENALLNRMILRRPFHPSARTNFSWIF